MFKTLLLFFILNIQVAYALSNDESEPLYKQGIQQGWQKDYSSAIISLEKAISISPNNTKYILALARVHSWSGDIEKAHNITANIIAENPTNIDAKVLQARLYYYQQNNKKAEDILKTLPQNKEVEDLLKLVIKARNTHNIIKPTGRKWYIATGLERSTLSRIPQPAWLKRFVEVGYHVSDDLSTLIRHENEKRSNMHKEYYELGASYKFNNTNTGYIGVGYANQATFLPEARFKIGGQTKVISNHKILGDTHLTLDMQYNKYNSGIENKTLSPGFKYNITNNLAISAKHINIIDDNSKNLRGWSTRFDWHTPWNKVRLNAHLASAPETEAGVTIKTKSKAIGASYLINDSLTLYLAYSHNNRQGSYIRKNISTALLFKF